MHIIFLKKQRSCRQHTRPHWNIFVFTPSCVLLIIMRRSECALKHFRDWLLQFGWFFLHIFFQRTLGHAETFCMDIKECNADHNEEVRACTEAFSRPVISWRSLRTPSASLIAAVIGFQLWIKKHIDIFIEPYIPSSLQDWYENVLFSMEKLIQKKIIS